MTPRKAPRLADFRRIVVKVGSSLLVDSAAGRRAASDWLASLADDIARAARRQARRAGGVVGRDRARPRGAQAAARAAQARGLAGRRRGRPDRAGAHLGGGARRATASRPARCWSRSATPKSAAAISTRARPSSKLLEWRAVPVINENDTVATNEIRYGDNDRLAARVATMASADLLVLLSDIDGLYDAPPGAKPRRQAHPAGRAHHARDRGDGGRGRLGTVARRHADQDRGRQDRDHGRHAYGDRVRPASSIRCARSPTARRCTWFLTPANPVTARKKWIAGSLEPQGHADHRRRRGRGAARGKSLLPAGVMRVDGAFARGDAVIIRGPGRRRDRPRACRLRRRGCREDQGPIVGRYSPRSSVWTAAPR